MKSFYIKTKRMFSPIRHYAWILTLLVGVGGLWFPKLGLLVIGIMLSLLIMAFLRGRFWCGNFCPHGSYFDSLLPISKNRKIPKFFRSKFLVIGFFLWFSFNLGRKFVGVSAFFGTATFLDRLGFVFVSSYLMVIIVGTILSLVVTSRTWCHFCPMGVVQRLSYKLGRVLGVTRNADVKVSIASKDMCHECGKCARVCPMQLTPYTEFTDKYQFDNDICIKCATCVENCPADILSIQSEKDALATTEQTERNDYEERQRIIAESYRR